MEGKHGGSSKPVRFNQPPCRIADYLLPSYYCGE